MKKKILLVGIIAILIASLFLLTGCGNTQENQNTDAQIDDKQSSTTEQENITSEKKEEVQQMEDGYYGAEVTNYEIKNEKYKDDNIKWKIFLDDGENIYLIADNYIKKDNIPVKGKDALSGLSEYTGGVSFSNILDDYDGITDIKNNTKILPTLDRYHKWVNKITNDKANENIGSIKSIAYMLDTRENIWGAYAGDYAEYAIGGPTIEMFCASYNKTHSVGIDYNLSDVLEYQLKLSTDSSYKYSSLTGVHTDEKDNLYVINDYKGAYGMWLATLYTQVTSLGDTVKNELLYVDYEGDICASGNGNYAGFRPVICLKSDVKLEKQTDGTYKII